MNEKLLIGILAILAAVGLFFLPVSGMAAAEIVVLHLIQVALLLGIVFATFYLLRGTKFDVWEKIAPEDWKAPNIALAIVLAAIVIGISNVIGK